MTLADTIFHAPVDTVVVTRTDRQRTTIEVADLKNSILRIGQLHPIIVRRDMRLVAGERRLQACKELGLSVACRYLDTLSETEASIVELEENLKRSELPWRDMVNATSRIHELYRGLEPTWTQEKTAVQLGLSSAMLSQVLAVAARMDDPKIAEATTWRSAYNFLMRESSRASDAAVSELLDDISDAFQDTSTPTAQATVRSQSAPQPLPTSSAIQPDAILQQDFLLWAPAYTGPKFNFIHCDFPYGINVFAGPLGPHSSTPTKATREGRYEDSFETYTVLVDCLVNNIDRLLLHSGHVMFWFSMVHYEYTRARLASVLTVNPTPLVWIKSDNAGVIPDPKRGPRQITEFAFLCYRGDRFIVKAVSNGYSSPTDKSIHPSAKPEPMLRHFFGMMVDNSTRMLDPTCGGGSAVRVAEDFKAEAVLGLEVNPEYVKSANDATRSARILRVLSKG